MERRKPARKHVKAPDKHRLHRATVLSVQTALDTASPEAGWAGTGLTDSQQEISPVAHRQHAVHILVASAGQQA